MTIISNRHLSQYRPDDIIPDDYFTAESLAHALATNRVHIVAGEPTNEAPTKKAKAKKTK